LSLGTCGCGGKLKIIAAIEELEVIERILTHLELSAQASENDQIECANCTQNVAFRY
jgi:hypothetical protein